MARLLYLLFMSINQYTMNSLLDNQKIKKRRHFAPVVPAANFQWAGSQRDESRHDSPRRDKSGSRRGKAAFRPAGISSLFWQNSKLIDKIKQEPARIHHRKPDTTFDSQVLNEPRQDGNRRFRPFTLPAIPFSVLFIFILGVFFVIHNQGLDWLGREAAGFEKDGGSRYNLALYAGVNPALNQEAALNPENSSSDFSKERSDGAIPLDLTEVFAWHSYKVKKGDSVSKIALNFSVSMDAIIASNGITNARALREGEVLRIPNMDGIPYTVKKGDSLSGISSAMGVPLEAILDANDIQSDVINAGATLFIPGARMNREDLKMALGELFIYPIRGARLSSPFGWRNDPISGVRRHHAALDLSAPQGTPVKAAMEGKVSAVSYENTYGNFIIISHAGGYQTMYAHLHTVLVKKGDQLAQGIQIGSVGNTGYSTGPHLHFAIFRNGRAVNPLDFLNSQR
jgi:murein DD-endopeptidase MepM/ murein hydrolase activator NlpD